MILWKKLILIIVMGILLGSSVYVMFFAGGN